MVVSRALYERSCPHCGGSHPIAEAILPPDYFGKLTPEVEKLVQSVYNGTKPANSILSLIGKLLVENVTDSYSTVKADWKTPDIEMLHRLTRDVWSFSAAKNYQEMRDLTLALKDEKGKLREFEVFKTEAQKVCDKYNETWLRTEYEMSVASSQNAARWVEFTKDAKDIPFLKYQTVGDDAVRATHAVLDGIVRNIKDAFWSTHYPPNGWGCRCEVLQEPGAQGNKKDLPGDAVVPEMFRTNLAQTGLIYPKNHPYYDGIPKAEIRKAIAYLPPENTYLTTNIGNKTVIDIHPLHGDNELGKNIDACRVLKNMDKKAQIKLLPILNEKDKAAKKAFFGDDYLKKFPTTSPDLTYNGKIAEIEVAANTKTSVKNRVRDGKEQAEFVLIQISEDMSLDDAFRHANGQMNHYKDKKDLTVWLFNTTGKRELSTKKKR